MYLKSLEMQGFKSFPDRTKLEFGSGATVIIGPNGSGKSNISDAMRWVLGEISTKNIRGAKMEDIIFGGADSRRPMGFAEVSVTFDNTDEEGRIDCPYDEVTVTRKYFRDRDSKYYINKKECKLRDIYELFMNTGIGRDGYSIIGQGRIAEIISRKDEERRSIFEDAAGIAKYRHKKKDAERQLSHAEDNMNRAQDIITVLEGRIGPLQKESVKAQRYVEYYEIKKEADVRLWLYDTEMIRGRIKEAEEVFRRSHFELSRINEELDSLSAREAALTAEMTESKLLSEQLNERIKARMTENHALDKDIELAGNDISHARELISGAERAIAALEGSIAEGKRVLAEAELAQKEKSAQIDGVISDIEQSESDISGLSAKIKKQKDNIAEAFGDMMELENELAKNSARVEVIENSGSADVDKHESLTGEISIYESRIARSSARLDNINKTVSDYTEALKKERLLLSEQNERLTSVKEELRVSEEALKASQLKVDRLAQRISNLKRMEEHFEGYGYSVRFVMKEYLEGRFKAGKIYGPLSSCISVGDDYVVAIETVLGTSLQNIVMDNERTAKAAIELLKSARAGRATFYPITSMSSNGKLPNEVERASGFKGYVGRASELVSCEGTFRPVIESLLGRTVVFDNIDNATAMARSLGYRVRTVTLDGQQINAGGSFTGGSVKQDTMLLSRAAERKKLEGELEELTAAYDKASKENASLSTLSEELENEVLSINERIQIIDGMRSSEETEGRRVQAAMEADAVLLENLKKDLNGLSSKKKQYEDELASLAASSKEIREKISAIKEYRTDLNAEVSDLEDGLALKNDALTALKIRLGVLNGESEAGLREISSIGERILRDEEAINAEKQRTGELAYKIEFLEALRKERESELASGNEELSELVGERERTERGNAEFEQRMNDLRASIKLKNDAREALTTDHVRNENALNLLKEEQERTAGKLWEDYTMTRADALLLNYPPVTEENRPEVLKTQTDYRNKLRNMGTVNVSAIDEYKEVKEQYDKSVATMEDLRKSRAKLMKIIGELEAEMRVAFTETFNKINENFGKTFSELFGGGSAELILTDPDDVLTSGIEIKAAPPGKIIKSLVQLSGGEQSFIAIALFFAILGVNPTPFCILDEIEAALDEVNVDRLSKYISRYSGKTQFILITHRRGTMDAADILYGVTMPERGISKVLTLNINEISKQKGEEWDGIFG